jgi:fructose-specific PTS system IIB-like component
MDFTIVAVTACVSGVAHTYMAAERLEKVGHQEKWNIKIETQGALGWRTKSWPTISPMPMSFCW